MDPTRPERRWRHVEAGPARLARVRQPRCVRVGPLALIAIFGLGCPAEVDLDACNSSPGPTPSAADLCAHLEDDLGCFVDALDMGAVVDVCPDAYATEQARRDPESFRLLTTCYQNARSCIQLEACSRACGSP